MGVPRGAWLRRVLSVGVRTTGRSVDAGREAGGTAPPRAPSPSSGFEHFYTTHYPAVTRLAYSLCGSMTIAEEVAQEAFATAHARWRRIAAFDRPDLWVRRVVINRSLSYRRKQRSERNALQRVSQRRQDAIEPTLSDHELWTALRSLSPRQAEVLALVYIEDQAIAEVAVILGLGEETVRTHLKRGRRELAHRLGHDRATTPPITSAPRPDDGARR